MRGQYPCDYAKACHILYCIHQLGWTVTRTSIELEVNLGTVSRVARGLYFPEATPMPPPDFGARQLRGRLWYRGVASESDAPSVCRRHRQ